MSVDPHFYEEIEFSAVQEHEIGGVQVLVGRLTQGTKLSPSVYAAALDLPGLHHRRPQLERGFGTTTALAIAALFNRMG